MEVRRLQAETVPENFLRDFCHRSEIRRQWEKREGQWELREVNLLHTWDGAKKQWMARYVKENVEGGGASFGAFEGEVLAGFGCVEGELSGDTANLAMLFVDDRYKRRGTGRALFAALCQAAREMGAKKLFISAVPSWETVAFYQKLGFTDAEEIIESFVDMPEDRFMIFVL